MATFAHQNPTRAAFQRMGGKEEGMMIEGDGQL
jgi:hypothetical protein